MEVVPAAKPQKRPLGDENAGGAIDAQDASKKQRAAAPAEAPTVELTKEVKEAAQAFRKHANKHAPGWEAQGVENAAALVERVAKENQRGLDLIVKPVARELDENYTSSWKATKVRSTIKKHLTSVPAAAFVAAGAPPETEEKEEGHVEGEIDVKLAKGDDVWHRYRDTTAAGAGTPGVSRQQIETALEKQSSDPADPYARQRGFEVRRVTDATRCATATNKVVRGFHEEAKVWRMTTARERHATAIAVAEEEEEAKAALAVAAKEKEEAVRKARYEMFGLTYSSVPPLPDGATDADLERLMREDLAALYGH